MSSELAGKRIAFIVANEGVEQPELEKPWQALRDAGADTVLIAPDKDTVKAVNNDLEPGDSFDADLALADADPAEFDALVLPGGTVNADKVRAEDDAVAFVKAIVAAGKPIAAICHGPWALVEAGAVQGKNLTSFPSLQTDIRNAGGTWHDQESYTCHEGGWTLVTSRNPDDIPAFVTSAIAAFSD